MLDTLFGLVITMMSLLVVLLIVVSLSGRQGRRPENRLPDM